MPLNTKTTHTNKHGVEYQVSHYWDIEDPSEWAKDMEPDSQLIDVLVEGIELDLYWFNNECSLEDITKTRANEALADYKRYMGL